MPKFRIAVGTFVAFLLLTSVALAHHVTSFNATCADVTATFESFNDSNKPVNWLVTVDSVQSLNGSFAFTGSTGTLTASYAQPLPAGDHSVGFEASWPNQDGENGEFNQVVYGCPGPPTPPPTPPAASPTTAPAVATPPTVNTNTPPVTTVKEKSHHSRFGVPGHPRKKCVHGRRHLKDSQGRRFTVCIKHAKPPIVLTPKFTG